MKRQLWTTVSASTLAAALVLTGASAALAEDPPVVPAMLTVDLEPNVLTLPAADGVRDTTVVRFVSDAPTIATVKVLSADRVVEYLDLGPVEFAPGSLVKDVEIPVGGLVAGSLLVEATPAGGTAVSTQLLVGSGQPQSAALSLSRSTIYTWTGSSARTSIATVSAIDETGLEIPFAGTVTVGGGTVTKTVPVSSTTGDAGTATIGTKSLPWGTYSVAATAYAEDRSATTDAATLRVKSMSVSSVSLTRTATSVYPSADGYKDSATFSLTSVTSTGGTIPVTGSVKIKRSDGKTVKWWSLSSSKDWSRTWDGRISNRIVPGTYRVEARVKGPEGTTKTDRTSITIRSGHLESRRYTSYRYPGPLFTAYTDYSEFGQGECTSYSDGDVDCGSYDAYFDDTLALIDHGHTNLPAVVKDAQQYGKVKARLTLHTHSLIGSGAWGFGPEGDEAAVATGLAEGWTTPGWKTLPLGSRRVDLAVGLGEYSYFWADSLKVEYSYKVLVR